MRTFIHSGLQSAQQLVSLQAPARLIKQRFTRTAARHHSPLPCLSAAEQSVTLGQAISLRWGAKRRKLSTSAPATAAQAEAGDGGPWLLVGLGNPGPKYDGNRHNIGFHFLEHLSSSAGIALDKKQHNALVGRGRLWDKTVLLAQPQTYMNNSGKSVRKIADYYKVPLQQILVIYDDLDLPTGKVRLRVKGGHGGHNGMRSIIAEMGNTQEFPRLRIGISRPPGQMAVADYVLQDFSKAEKGEMEFALREAEDIVKAVFVEGMDRAISGVRT